MCDETRSRGGEDGSGLGHLSLVATPIGNLGDLSPRARDVLQAAELILAEDTRRTRKLCTHFGIATRIRAFHEHNEDEKLAGVLELLRQGRHLALVTDAGTPVLADPGYRLVRACHERGVPVTVIPGPSAVAAAVALSGLPPQPFTFIGFLPPRRGPRRSVLGPYAALPHTLVVFLSPHRLLAELEDLAAVLGGQREATLMAELTKLNERCLCASLDELAVSPDLAHPRGEYTLVIGPPAPPPPGEVSSQLASTTLEAVLAEGATLADARREAARRLGVSRKQLYALVMKTKASSTR